MSENKDMGAPALLSAYAFGDEIWPGLAKLNEECGELIQVVGKMMMVHGGRAHWSGDLRAMLRDEMADVLAAIGFVMKYGFTEEEERSVQDRADQKWIKFEAWHDDPDSDQPPPIAQTDPVQP